jgi:L,D-transpeptidase ErfK/SrfK
MPPAALPLIVAAMTLLSGNVARGETLPLPPAGIDIVGKIRVIRARHDDTLLDIARRHGVGQDEIVAANPGVDRWLPGEGTAIVLPTRYILPDAPREGIVVNLPEMRLYYYPKPRSGEAPTVVTHPVSVGRMDWSTPLGLTRIVRKQADPAWHPPASIRAEAEAAGTPLPERIPPGPDNPLGQYALRLGIPGYLIHGTNRPYGVGMRVTHGCMRMYPEDIETMFSRVPLNTPVRLVNQPVKAALLADSLFLEVHVSLEELPMSEADALAVGMNAIERAAGAGYPGLEASRAQEVIHQHSGVPEVISRRVRPRV